MQGSTNGQSSRTLQYAVAQSPPSSPRRRPLPGTPSGTPAAPVTPLRDLGSPSRGSRTPALAPAQHQTGYTSKLVKRNPEQRLSKTMSPSSELWSPPPNVTQWTPPPSSTPLSAEHYWTTRALAGESLHSMHLQHQYELQCVVAEQERKRERELTMLAESQKQADRRRENFMMTLLIGMFITLLMTLHVAGRATQPPPPNKWLSTHFTIPILSPFASVVEHEASIVGTKVLSVCVIVFGAVAYASLRYWLSRPR